MGPVTQNLLLVNLWFGMEWGKSRASYLEKGTLRFVSKYNSRYTGKIYSSLVVSKINYLIFVLNFSLFLVNQRKQCFPALHARHVPILNTFLGTGGSVRACHAAGTGRSPVGTSFLGEVFRGFSSPVRQMSGSFRPQDPRISFGHHYHHYSSFITGANDLRC